VVRVRIWPSPAVEQRLVTTARSTTSTSYESAAFHDKLTPIARPGLTLQRRARGAIPEMHPCGLSTSQPAREWNRPHRADFLTFSNGAAGNGRKGKGSAGSRATKKPCRITRIGSGRDSPEPPKVVRIPLGLPTVALFCGRFLLPKLQQVQNQVQTPFTTVAGDEQPRATRRSVALPEPSRRRGFSHNALSWSSSMSARAIAGRLEPGRQHRP
jgi:hypothetical protein